MNADSKTVRKTKRTRIGLGSKTFTVSSITLWRHDQQIFTRVLKVLVGFFLKRSEKNRCATICHFGEQRRQHSVVINVWSRGMLGNVECAVLLCILAQASKNKLTTFWLGDFRGGHACARACVCGGSACVRACVYYFYVRVCALCYV